MWYWRLTVAAPRTWWCCPTRRLLLFSRYLQQLVMESLGKELDLQGRVVSQGLSVYGNKGSTDQHAYGSNCGGSEQLLRHLRRGPARPCRASLEVDSGGVTCGDYLEGFLWHPGRAE